ncbi:hypothetical protein V5E97_21135 [Singulisphaera sp. Ch08]|uniref:Tetratricopeptide repeat protein n=1 Tax=Singulisphaera sp. Ch08 TaxID=3120278 RepID=A0AAU7C6H4_9BACT
MTTQKRSASTAQYWKNYYRTHTETSKDLKDKVTLLNVNKKSQDVEAVLRGYLTYHSKHAEPWMYEALALAIKMNKGPEKDFKIALGFAADMAERSHNPNHLVSVADLMLLNGEYDRVGKLLDEAAEKIPHRSEPLIMMINLAQKTKTPERMAMAIEKLFALGWPGFDERIRPEARQQAETLAKSLREEGRSPEAETLLARVAAAEYRDVFVRLTWTGDASLGLMVEEPLGATASDVMPRTVFGGAIIKLGYGTHPESVYVCPRGFDGDYTIKIETIYNNPDKPALEATLELITHEGTTDEKKETKTIRVSKTPDPVVLHLKGGHRKTAMPFLAPPTLPPTVPAAGSAKGTSNDSDKPSGSTQPAPESSKPIVVEPAQPAGVKERPR